MKKLLIFLFSVFAAFVLLIACSDDDGFAQCEDPRVGREFQDTICNNDCRFPVCGCDNQTYCNECLAGKQGVAVSYHHPCGQDRRR